MLTLRRLLRALAYTLAAVVGLLVLVGALFYTPDQPSAALLERYANADSRFARIAGMDVHYRLTGRAGAPTLLCLHGFASSLHTWDGWAAALGDSLRVLRLDLPGYGLTGPPPQGGYSTALHLAVLDTLLGQLGLDSVYVAGNSMGGALAAAYAAHRPERVRRLVLIDAAGAPGGSRGSAVLKEARRGGSSGVLGLLRVPVLGDLLPTFTPRFLVGWGLREVYHHDSLVTPELVDRYYDLLTRAGNRQGILQRVKQAPRMDRAGADLSAIRARVLIVWGAEDRWIPVVNAERYQAALLQARTVVYPDLGHVPMEEDPSRTARDTRSFLLQR